MVIAIRYRNRRNVAGAGPLLLELRLQGESFEVSRKKKIRLIVFESNTTIRRCSFTFPMTMDKVGQQSPSIKSPENGQLPNAVVNLMRQRRLMSTSIFNWAAAAVNSSVRCWRYVSLITSYLSPFTFHVSI